MKKRYDFDPRVFWNRASTKTDFPEFLIIFSIFKFSLLVSSASCERTFSHMSWIVSERRSCITSENGDKRLKLANQLPQRKRLLGMCDSLKIKRRSRRIFLCCDRIISNCITTLDSGHGISSENLKCKLFGFNIFNQRIVDHEQFSTYWTLFHTL